MNPLAGKSGGWTPSREESQRLSLPCTAARRWMSPYLDGALTGNQMLALQGHFRVCSACSREYAALQRAQQLLCNSPRAAVPADLDLKLRLLISRESAARRRPLYEGLRLRLENTLDAFMVPATAGLACAILIFGLVAAILAIPGQLQANNREDVPLVLNTGPELQQSAFGTLSSINAESLVIEAFVDSRGRIEDYKILSDPGDTQDLLPQVKRLLIFTTFRPAMSMGHPIASRAVLSFSRISVRG
jgi:hypothetical protein